MPFQIANSRGSPILLALLVLAFLAAPVRAANPASFPDLLEYADRLFGDRDFYGAASEYKKLLYFYPADAKQAGVDERLCRVYLLAGEYSRLKEFVSANRLFSPSFYLLSGLALFLQGDNELSAWNLEKAGATNLAEGKRDLYRLVQAVNYARLGDLQRGYRELALVSDARQEILEVKVSLKKDLDLYGKMRRKNPGLSLGLSIVPGLGLIYAGSWPEGLGTMLAGGLGLWAGYLNIKDRNLPNLLLWSAAFLYFYVTNFQSAWEKTKKYNEEIDSFLLKRMNENFYFQGLLERYSMDDTPCPVTFYAIRRNF